MLKSVVAGQAIEDAKKGLSQQCNVNEVKALVAKGLTAKQIRDRGCG